MDSDPEWCEFCGTTLDYSYELAEFGVCQPCNRKLDTAFIRGFALIEGEHFETDASGEVSAWCGDATLAGASVWMTLCARVPHWEDEPLDALVFRTRRLLQAYHGQMPEPFALVVEEQQEDMANHPRGACERPMKGAGPA